MKKILCCIILLSTFSIVLHAEKNKIEGSIGVEYNFMLAPWQKSAALNKYMADLGSVDLSAQIDWSLYKSFGIYFGAATGGRGGGAGIPDNFNFWEQIDLNNFYQKDIEKVEKSRLSLKIQMGLFNKWNFGKWSITPYVGIGADYTPMCWLRYGLKEKGTNTAYNISYNWFGKKAGECRMLEYCHLQFKADWNFTEQLALFIGINIRQYWRRQNFTALITDYYDQHLIREVTVLGSRGTTMGIRLGLSF